MFVTEKEISQSNCKAFNCLSTIIKFREEKDLQLLLITLIVENEQQIYSHLIQDQLQYLFLQLFQLLLKSHIKLH